MLYFSIDYGWVLKQRNCLWVSLAFAHLCKGNNALNAHNAISKIGIDTNFAKNFLVKTFVNLNLFTKNTSNAGPLYDTY